MTKRHDGALGPLNVRIKIDVDNRDSFVKALTDNLPRGLDHEPDWQISVDEVLELGLMSVDEVARLGDVEMVSLDVVLHGDGFGVWDLSDDDQIADLAARVIGDIVGDTFEIDVDAEAAWKRASRPKAP